ncbi:hypothetical protein MST17_14610 [Acinetobacter sp. YH16056_T]|nr:MULTISPECIES: hypothetical protein [unclassified Acinetobacter]UUS60549.1 hypothetical protein MST17_14610 [Acinetobacter sp. YH16056_T]
MHKKQQYFIRTLLFSASMSLMYQVAWANETDAVVNETEGEHSQDVPETDQNSSYITPKTYDFLDQIPRWIDATPTFLPEQSDHPIVPTTEQTENNSWTDRQQKKVRNWADRTAVRMDNWFGQSEPDKPANATLRVILDNSWNKHDEYEIKPRIRGKIKLPTLEKKLSVVFGDDSLDNELENNAAITNENPAGHSDKNYDNKQTREDNSSLALRWSEISDRLPFETDVDLGLRSGDDLYVRLKAAKKWQLDNDFRFLAEQIYRYGIDSENYLRTNLELTHARPGQSFISNQFNLTYADTQDDDLKWDNFSFRQHQFFKGNRFSYGLYTGGFYNNDQLRLNSWGPSVSWRQPFLREWFYIQGDLNYHNNHRDDKSHFLGALVRLEALF